MRFIYSALFCLFSLNINALEYDLQFENEHVRVARLKLLSQEEIGLHRDEYRQVVIALKGGTITRIESDGSTTDVTFPTGQAVYREIDPPGQMHSAVNNSEDPIELIIIQLVQ